jgi:hypothetical protein
MNARAFVEGKWGSHPLSPGWGMLAGLTPRGQVELLALRFGRNAWPEVLFEFWLRGMLCPDDLRALLPEAWSGPEWPQGRLGIALWVDLFRTAGFVSDSARAPSSSPLLIHRGTTWGRRRGMAWTTDRERAEWFATRLHRPGGLVFTVTVDSDAVLAMIDGRNEHEVVVDPSRLPPVKHPGRANSGIEG